MRSPTSSPPPASTSSWWIPSTGPRTRRVSSGSAAPPAAPGSRRRCLDQLDEIAAVPGIDVLLIGPTDLSISLGVPGQMLHPTMQEAYRRVVDVANRHGVAAGIHPSDIKVVQHGRDIGMRLLMYASDVRLLLAAGRQAVEALRGEPRRQ